VKTVCLIACVSKKQPVRAPAKELYISPLFKSAFAFAQTFQPDYTFILSAKYGLVDENEEIDPYDVTLSAMSSTQIREWAQRILAQLKSVADLETDNFIVLAGDNYRKYLVPHLANCEIPLRGMRIGQQLQFLKSFNCV